jgi:hypothetical protein
MSRTHRTVTARLGLAALLFMQLAVAAYACPTPGQGAPSVVTAPAAHPCGMKDTHQPKLCEQHCVGDAGTSNGFAQPLVAMPAVLTVALCVQPALSAVVHEARGAHRASAVDPPPLVRFGVLRI